MRRDIEREFQAFAGRACSSVNVRPTSGPPQSGEPTRVTARREPAHVQSISVNGGGLRDGRDRQEVENADWNDIVDVNPKGSFLICQAVTPSMIAGCPSAIRTKMIEQTALGRLGKPNAIWMVIAAHRKLAPIGIG